MVHAAMAELQPGEVLVLTMPEPRPVALVGDLLATQAQGPRRRGDPGRRVGSRSSRSWPRSGCRSGRDGCGSGARTRDARARSASRSRSAARRSARATWSCSTPTGRGGRAERLERCSRLAAREGDERVKRAKLQPGALSFDLDGLRAACDERAAPRPRSHRPCRAADAVPRGEPAFLRRAVRDGGPGPRGPVGVPARLGRLPALQPEADRVGAARARAHRDPRLERGGAGAARRARSSATGCGIGWDDGDHGHGPAYRFTDPDGHAFELYYEVRALRRRPTISARRSRTCRSATSAAAPRSSGSTTSTSSPRRRRRTGGSPRTRSASASTSRSCSTTAPRRAPG